MSEPTNNMDLMEQGDNQLSCDDGMQFFDWQSFESDANSSISKTTILFSPSTNIETQSLTYSWNHESSWYLSDVTNENFVPSPSTANAQWLDPSLANGFSNLETESNDYQDRRNMIQQHSNDFAQLTTLVPLTGLQQNVTHVFSPSTAITSHSHFVPEKSVDTKVKKPRVHCQHEGCHETFPRKYEMSRHMKNIHERLTELFCPVYGCQRISKPFARLDKFWEHFYKQHKNAQKFICLIQECRNAPLSRQELKEHLVASHPNRDLTNSPISDVLDVLSYVSIITRSNHMDLMEFRVCPFSSGGCDWVVSEELKPHLQKKHLNRHLMDHELKERIQLEPALLENISHSLSNGLVTCLICSKRFEGGYWVIYFERHFHSHSKEEKSFYSKDIISLLLPVYENGNSWARDILQRMLEVCGLTLKSNETQF